MAYMTRNEEELAIKVADLSQQVEKLQSRIAELEAELASKARKRRANPASSQPEHSIWCNFRARCRNPKPKDLPYYAHVTVCERWDRSFAAFLQDMGPRPGKGYDLKRIDSSKGYEPGNCRWEPSADTPLLTFNGKSQTVSQWAKERGLTYNALKARLKNKWSLERALRQPLRAKEKRGE